MRTAQALAVLLVLSSLAFPADIYVPDDVPTIQGAIDAASPGDAVIVRPGWYVENVDFRGKAIRLKSEWGPGMTVIDGSRTDSTVIVGSLAALEGFTITNGHAANGGGILCDGSNSIIQNNHVTGNVAADKGGGIYCVGSVATVITDTAVTGNRGGDGGGVACYNDASPIFRNCTVSRNTSNRYGGGLFCYRTSSPTMVNSILWDNTAAAAGDEIWIGNSFHPSTFTISHSDVAGGQAAAMVDSGCTLDWGSGMIDADPLFIRPSSSEYRISFASPCRDAGDNASVFAQTDIEGDPRRAGGIPEMGADEFYPHISFVGRGSGILPGDLAAAIVTGLPGAAVRIALGSGLVVPPTPTPLGNFYLQPPIVKSFDLGQLPGEGYLIVPFAVPAGWLPGQTLVFQAFTGAVPPSLAMLTNPAIVVVR